jgi:hypothetical protein
MRVLIPFLDVLEHTLWRIFAAEISKRQQMGVHRRAPAAELVKGKCFCIATVLKFNDAFPKALSSGCQCHGYGS